MKWTALIPLALIAEPIAAQTLSGVDPAAQTIDVSTSSAVRVATVTGKEVSIALDTGERIRSAALADPTLGDLKIANSRRNVTIKPLANGGVGVATVHTSDRTYTIEFAIFQGGVPTPHEVRLVRGQQAKPQQARSHFITWDLDGSAMVRPASIEIVGGKTHITWRPDQAIPAVFALRPDGAVEMVNGYFRDDVFVIDRVLNHLQFRLDKDVATARLVEVKGRDRHG